MTTVKKSRTASWTLGTSLWGVAFLSLAMAALLSPPDASGITGLTIAGHGLTAVALTVDIKRGRRRGPEDAAFLTGVLLIFGLVELVGWLVAHRAGEADQALWFAVGLGFTVAGIVASLRGGGSDGAIASQLFFHGVLIVPALGSTGSLVGVLLGTIEADQAFGHAGPIGRLLFTIAGIALPPLFAMLVAVLAYDLGHHGERESPVWPALLAHQAAYVVIASRWMFHGI
ncbi:MAG: hypothetical protein JWN86_1699 [Planctomycetota bacterium]|nr:hypothetical protein [Planctomycetota bacterium]